jgi:asparagine synthase (glutamine-hydrolysing)
MCGIAGYWSEAGMPDGSLIRRMCDRLVHRGPDADGYYADAEVALGHRRLSIIDVTGGDQPLSNEDGSVQVVFNGEIYNYRELRQNLARRGHAFKTRSDTEVLVHLYEEVGERLVEHLNGMFAFTIWDARQKELLLARDRLGKKPLYYSFSVPGLRICFASELKALMELPQFPANVNSRAVADFLALSYVPEPETIYKDVFKLEAAHTLRVNDSRTEKRRYWTPEFAEAPAADLRATEHELSALAKDAVERRMISDVPLGVFLSGGLDSSAVLGLMAQLSDERVKSFSIGFTSKDLDEIWYARLAAIHNRSEHHEYIVSPSVHEVLQSMVDHFDEPFGDSSAIPMLYLAKITRQDVTVALTGDGADELFGGYRRYYFGVLEQKIRDRFPAWFRQSAFRLGARWYPKFDYLPRVFRAKTMLSNLAQELADAYFTSMSTFRDGGLNNVLGAEIRRDLGGYSPRQTFRDRFDSVCELHPLHQLQAVDLQTYLPGDILVKADRTTMLHGLEARAPWLDYRIAELSFRLPPSFLLRGRTGKYIFRRAVAPYVPPALLTRRKMGFSVPLAEWFRTSLRPTFESMVLREEFAQFVSLPEVRRIWAEHQSNFHNHDRKLWNLLMLAGWTARRLPSAASRGSELDEACVLQ